MSKKHLPGCWSLVPANTPVPEPEPELLTDALIQDFIESNDAWPYDAILEALARLTDYYAGMEAYVSAEIDKEIAEEEADA
jgi:hypothetical protein